MAEKGFGVKEVNLIGASGTPTITSPNNINMNAVNVAISTNVSIGGTLSVTGNVSVGGTLTYEDVTNIDSIGVITARSGVDVDDFISVGSNIHLGNAGIITASSYRGDGSQLTGITGTTINNNADNRIITGSGTANTLNGESTLTYDGTNLDLGDSKKIRLGASQDLELYHNGTDSWIVNNTGYLRINSDNIFIKDGDNDDMFIRCQHDAGVTLYYNNNRKFEILNTGAIVIGTLSATTFSGSGASLTSIPAAQLTGTLPAIDGSNLTGLGVVTSDVSNYNTSAGSGAGSNFSGSDAKYNSLFGADAGNDITTGDYNSAFGFYSLTKVTTASHNTGFGQSTLRQTVTGAENTAVGSGALEQNTSSYNTAVGYQALYVNTTGSYNTTLGWRAGKSNTSASSITAMGVQALESNTTGEANVAVGAYALNSVTTSSNNVAVGQQSLYGSTGTANVAIGHQAGKGNSGTSGAVVLGYRAAYNQTNDYLVAIGYEAAYNGGNYGVAIGYGSLKSQATAQGNIGIGHRAAESVTGNHNTVIGRNACFTGTNNLTSGTNNIVIGYEAATSSATISNEITLGNSSITRFRIPGLGLDFNGNNLDLGDSKKIRLGTGNDLNFYHNGSHSYIQNTTGSLYLDTSGNFYIRNSAGSSTYMYASGNEVALYHTGSIKFETSAYGVKVTGGAHGNTNSHNGGTVTFDFSSAAYHFVNMNSNSTFSAPINSQIGHSGSIFLTQDGTGGRTGAFNSAFKFAGGTAPTLSTAANAVDRLDFVVLDDSPLTVHVAVSLDVK